jgi:hypothetical protein
MAVDRSLLAFGLALSFHTISGAACATREKPSAFDLLAKSLRCDCGFNVCALIQQRDPFGSGLQRVKVDRDRNGKIHKLVLGPLTMQGVESLDDGIRWQTILPDENLVLDQESPSRDQSGAEKRLRLARKNYRFDFLGETTIAGRRAFRIQACPLRPSLACRAYVLDAETLYPLKEESIQDGQAQLEFLTLDISFPKALNEDQFGLRPEVGMKVVKFERPQSIREPAEARRLLGFTPYMPKGDPLGFEPQEMQVSQNGDWQALVVRLTDGLARATLYEYMAGTRPVRAMDHSTTREIDGVRLMIVCPLSDSVRNALLDSLVPTSPSLLFHIAPPVDGTICPWESVRKNRAPIASR